MASHAPFCQKNPLIKYLKKRFLITQICLYNKKIIPLGNAVHEVTTNSALPTCWL